MTLRHLRIFLTVCRENSFTRAADALYMSQPAVSLAIREMEDYFKVRLFERISHKLYLTDPGKVALDYTDRILHQYEEMTNVLLQQTFHESLVIGNSVGSTIFSALMRGMEKDFPEIETNVITDHTSTIIQMVLKNECDIGIVEGTPSESGLECQVFAKISMILFLASTRRKKRSKTVRLKKRTLPSS